CLRVRARLRGETQAVEIDGRARAGQAEPRLRRVLRPGEGDGDGSSVASRARRMAGAPRDGGRALEGGDGGGPVGGEAETTGVERLRGDRGGGAGQRGEPDEADHR